MNSPNFQYLLSIDNIVSYTLRIFQLYSFPVSKLFSPFLASFRCNLTSSTRIIFEYFEFFAHTPNHHIDKNLVSGLPIFSKSILIMNF